MRNAQCQPQARGLKGAQDEWWWEWWQRTKCQDKEWRRGLDAATVGARREGAPVPIGWPEQVRAGGARG